MKHTQLTHKEVGGIINHADASIAPAKLEYPFTFSHFPTTPPEAPTEDLQVANKKYADDQADAAATYYVGITPVIYTAAAGAGWHTINLRPRVPPEARWAEIVHCNPDPEHILLAGSRRTGTGINRWTALRPLKQVSWTTYITWDGTVQVYGQRAPVYFLVVGYWL